MEFIQKNWKLLTAVGLTLAIGVGVGTALAGTKNPATVALVPTTSTTVAPVTTTTEAGKPADQVTTTTVAPVTTTTIPKPVVIYVPVPVTSKPVTPTTMAPVVQTYVPSTPTTVATAPKAWHTVATFSGMGERQTDQFVLSSEQQRITYSCSSDAVAEFMMMGNDGSGTDIDCSAPNSQGTSNGYASAGTYHIHVILSPTTSWTYKIEELR